MCLVGGTGFISLRFAYNYQNGQEILKNTRDVNEFEKQRMTKGSRVEVPDRLDSIIAKSKDRDSAIFIRRFFSFIVTACEGILLTYIRLYDKPQNKAHQQSVDGLWCIAFVTQLTPPQAPGIK